MRSRDDVFDDLRRLLADELTWNSLVSYDDLIGPCSEDEMRQAEATLGVSFTTDYAAFVQEFGSVVVGSEYVCGVNASKRARVDVVTATTSIRKRGWEIPAGDFVLSLDSRGNPVIYRSSGIIEMPDHDVGDVVDMGDTFLDYLNKAIRGELLG